MFNFWTNNIVYYNKNILIYSKYSFKKYISLLKKNTFLKKFRINVPSARNLNIVCFAWEEEFDELEWFKTD